MDAIQSNVKFPAVNMYIMSASPWRLQESKSLCEPHCGWHIVKRRH